MNKHVITPKEIARHLDRVSGKAESFTIVKNGKAVARLVPVQPKRCTGADLAQAIQHVPLTSRESRKWKRDLKKAKEHLKPVNDKWTS